MAVIYCGNCGYNFIVQAGYKGQFACARCKYRMHVEIDEINRVRSVTGSYPDPSQTLGNHSWNLLKEVEQNCLEEAAICLGNKAYTAAEFMSLKVLESLCRRYYKKATSKEYTGEKWFDILDTLKSDQKLKPYWSLLDYFRGRRNELGHPDKISVQFEAESSYDLCLRLTKELLGLIS